MMFSKMYFRKLAHCTEFGKKMTSNNRYKLLTIERADKLLKLEEKQPTTTSMLVQVFPELTLPCLHYCFVVIVGGFFHCLYW